MKLRLVWTPCPDCGRSSSKPGGCFVVERRGVFGWVPYLEDYDRGGCRQALHYPNLAAVDAALELARRPEPQAVVYSQWTE